MKISCLSVLLAITATQASPVFKRQDASSVVASASSAVESAVATATGSVAAPSASASAAPDFATGLLAALRERQATTLASLIEPLAGTLGPVLSSGEWTIFAPGNEYLAEVDTSNQTALTEVLSYHLVAGNYPAADLPVNTSVIAPTFLTASNLGANYTQLPIAFAKDVFGTTNIINQNISVLANATYQNIIIKLIDGVLTVPESIPTVAGNAGATSLVSALSSLLPDVVSTLESAQGVTVFAPDNASIDAAASTLAGIASSDPTAVSNAVQGHVIPSVVFSTNITDGLTATSLAGTELTFTANATGAFVTGNGVTAQITAPDNIASNGVVHVINALLFTPPAAAASGSASPSGVVASATSAAASAVSSAV